MLIGQSPNPLEDIGDKISTSLQTYYRSAIEVLPRVALAIIIVTVGYLLANWITTLVRRRLMGVAEDAIAAQFLTKVAKILLVGGVILVALNTAGLTGIATVLLGALGASSLILGFAFKDIGENFIAGIILAFSRPFGIGDAIEVNDYFGKVLQLKLRYTHLKTFDGKDVYVPNADVLTNSVTNYTADGFIRQDFIVGIGYENDIDGAIRLVREIVESEEGIINSAEHNSFACVDELAASTVNIKVRFWMETKDFRRVALEKRGDLMRDVKEKLSDAGYNLPADIMELKLYGDEKSIPVEIFGKAATEVAPAAKQI